MNTPPAPNSGTTKQTAGGSLSDILSAAKNIVLAVNALAQNYLNVQGLTNLAAISAATVAKGSGGRIAAVSVTTAGAAGVIYDAATTADTSKPVYIIPATLGVFNVNIPVNFGINVVPGAAQVVTVIYS